MNRRARLGLDPDQRSRRSLHYKIDLGSVLVAEMAGGRRLVRQRAALAISLERGEQLPKFNPVRHSRWEPDGLATGDPKRRTFLRNLGQDLGNGSRITYPTPYRCGPI